ncbi:hypothetical protein [Lysobacter fragariae]
MTAASTRGSACALAPKDKRRQLKGVGDDLVGHYGKRRYYTIQEVKDANRRQGISLDFGCWSHSAFNSHGDFDAYHASIGEACDYVAMKTEMLSSISQSNETSWLDFDFDLSWLEFPDIDWSIFDFLD